MARRYRPNLRPTTRASAAMLCAAIGAALLLSVGWPWLGSLGDILFVGTLARGVLVGILLTWIARRTRFAHSRAAASLAGAATLVAIAGGHYQLHREQRKERIAEAEELRMQSAGFGRESAELDVEFEQRVAALSFGNYLRDYFGLTPNSRGETEDAASSKLGPQMGIGLYVLELLTAVLAAAYFPAGQASEPACPVCGRWYCEEPERKAAYGTGSEFVAALERGQTDEAMALLQPPDTAEWVGISFAWCPAHCQNAPHVLRVRNHSRARSSGDLHPRHVADLELSASEYARLEEWV